MAAIDWKNPPPEWQKKLIEDMTKVYNSDWYRKMLYPSPHYITRGIDWAPYKEPQIRGLQADMIIIDDPLNQENRMTTAKPVKKDYNTIAVRFVYGHNIAKLYTYRVAKKAKFHLGQLLVSPPNCDGVKALCCVVEIHKTPQDTQHFDYKFITEKVSAL